MFALHAEEEVVVVAQSDGAVVTSVGEYDELATAGVECA